MKKIIVLLCFLPFSCFAATGITEKNFDYKYWNASQVAYSFGTRFVASSISEGIVFRMLFDEDNCSLGSVAFISAAGGMKKYDTSLSIKGKIRVDKKEPFVFNGNFTQPAFDEAFYMYLPLNNSKIKKQLVHEISSGNVMRVQLIVNGVKPLYLKYSLSGATATINKAYSWCESNPKYKNSDASYF